MSDKDSEFRPFSRRLPEFKFWYAATKAVLWSIVCTFFPALDLPVFWPILLMYFLLLVFITMKERVELDNRMKMRGRGQNRLSMLHKMSSPSRQHSKLGSRQM